MDRPTQWFASLGSDLRSLAAGMCENNPELWLQPFLGQQQTCPGLTHSDVHTYKPMMITNEDKKMLGVVLENRSMLDANAVKVFNPWTSANSALNTFLSDTVAAKYNQAIAAAQR